MSADRSTCVFDCANVVVANQSFRQHGAHSVRMRDASCSHMRHGLLHSPSLPAATDATVWLLLMRPSPPSPSSADSLAVDSRMLNGAPPTLIILHVAPSRYGVRSIAVACRGCSLAAVGMTNASLQIDSASSAKPTLTLALCSAVPPLAPAPSCVIYTPLPSRP